MNGTVTIRLAEAGDAGTIHAGLLALARATGAEGRIKSTPGDILSHGFGDHAAFEVLLAEIGGNFAGFCLTFPSYSTWRGERGIYVQDLYVDDAFRGHGIGEKLLRAAARRGAAGPRGPAISGSRSTSETSRHGLSTSGSDSFIRATSRST